MTPIDNVTTSLSEVMFHYQTDFSQKQYADNLDNTDVLMSAFGITQSLKRENKQYWGRQLGKCWEILTGQDTFDYIYQRTNFDMQAWLEYHTQQQTFFINRGSD